MMNRRLRRSVSTARPSRTRSASMSRATTPVPQTSPTSPSCCGQGPVRPDRRYPSTVLRSGGNPLISSRNTLLFEDPSVDGRQDRPYDPGRLRARGLGHPEGTTLSPPSLARRARPRATPRRRSSSTTASPCISPPPRSSGGEQLAEPTSTYTGTRRCPWSRRGRSEVSARGGPGGRHRRDRAGQLSGDIEEGKRLGRVTVSVDGERTARSHRARASRSVEATTLIDKVASTRGQNPAVLVPVGGFVIPAGLLLAARGRRSRTLAASPWRSGPCGCWRWSTARSCESTSRDGEVTDRIPVGSRPTAIAAGAGSLWVTDEVAGTVVRVEPGSGRVSEAIGVGNGPSSVAFGEGGGLGRQPRRRHCLANRSRDRSRHQHGRGRRRPERDCRRRGRDLGGERR